MTQAAGNGIDGVAAAGRAASSHALDTERALALFDRLDAVQPEALFGAWRGEEFPTGHPLDGLLAAYGWHGKRFDSLEDVHPLVFRAPWGGTMRLRALGLTLAVRLVLRLPWLKSAAVARLARPALVLLATGRSGARLRVTCYRGASTATMVYDQVPVHDVFRAVDADTVLGAMDMKGLSRPLFFLLRREAG
ncbi:MAG TPA: DUF4334 domain-containing protein [Ramlibacter sp.]|uniref:DUF4334 domain-containing protein n=1 Tax=Ramlibacter sp. TaxID=1917967 RepID=UPI002D3872FB|nr:DUF4334 domain-containing protein [Ramlibacter sp.]HZY17936.1 DUF4334 domain-containing protein [Ramlibacter sp.]